LVGRATPTPEGVDSASGMRCYRRARLERSTARLFLSFLLPLPGPLFPAAQTRPRLPLVSRLLGKAWSICAHCCSLRTRPGPLMRQARRTRIEHTTSSRLPPENVQRCSPALVRHKQYPGQTGILAAALPPIPWPSLTWAAPIASPTRVAPAHLPIPAALRRRGFPSPPSDGLSSRVFGCAFAARRASYLFCWILTRA
jgi:hypothetical protein